MAPEMDTVVGGSFTRPIMAGQTFHFPRLSTRPALATTGGEFRPLC